MQFKCDATCSRMFQIRKVRIKTSKKTEMVAVSMWRCFHASSASFLACANLKIWLSVRQASLPPGNILSNITMYPPESYHTLSISSYQFLYFSYCSTKPLLEYLVLIATARPLGCKSWVTVLRCTWVSSDFLIGNPQPSAVPAPAWPIAHSLDKKNSAAIGTLSFGNISREGNGRGW